MNSMTATADMKAVEIVSGGAFNLGRIPAAPISNPQLHVCQLNAIPLSHIPSPGKDFV